MCFTVQISTMVRVKSYVLKVDDNRAYHVFSGELDGLASVFCGHHKSTQNVNAGR